MGKVKLQEPNFLKLVAGWTYLTGSPLWELGLYAMVCFRTDVGGWIILNWTRVAAVSQARSPKRTVHPSIPLFKTIFLFGNCGTERGPRSPINSDLFLCNHITQVNTTMNTNDLTTFFPPPSIESPINNAYDRSLLLSNDDNAPPRPMFLHMPNDNGSLVLHDDRRSHIRPISQKAPSYVDILKVDRKHLTSQVVGVDLMCDFGLHHQCYDRVASDPTDPRSLNAPHFSLKFHFSGSAERRDFSTMILDVSPAWKRTPRKDIDVFANVRCWSIDPAFLEDDSPVESVLSTAILNPGFQTVITAITGKFILELVTNHNLNLFSLRQGGGCRHWIYELCRIMEDARITRPGWSNDVLAKIKCHWIPIPDKNPQCVPMLSYKLVQGVFRMPLNARQRVSFHY